MRRWKHRDVQDDPPKDPELVHWFQTLGPPPIGQAPPNLRVKVRARIEQQRARRGVFAWMPSVGSPAWAVALAMVLVVSVGLNVWWGVTGFGPRPSGNRQVADTSVGDLGPAGRLRTYRFQVGMARAPELGTFVAAHPALREPTAVVGFPDGLTVLKAWGRFAGSREPLLKKVGVYPEKGTQLQNRKQ